MVYNLDLSERKKQILTSDFNIASFSKKLHEICDGLVKRLRIENELTESRVFIDASNLKAVLMNNVNEFLYVPVADVVYIQATYYNLK